MVLKARIDTGAGMSSVHAKIIEFKRPEKEGEPERVVFRVQDGEHVSGLIEREVTEWIRIKKKGAEGVEPRPVVKLDICLAGKQVEARVNLADRSAFMYPLLIGRNILNTGEYLVDPEPKFIEYPNC